MGERWRVELHSSSFGKEVFNIEKQNKKKIEKLETSRFRCNPSSCFSSHLRVQPVNQKLQRLQKPRPRLLPPPHRRLLLPLRLPHPQPWAPFPPLCPLCHLCQHMLWTPNQVSFNQTDGPCHVRSVLVCVHALDLQLTRLIIVQLPAQPGFASSATQLMSNCFSFVFVLVSAIKPTAAPAAPAVSAETKGVRTESRVNS